MKLLNSIRILFPVQALWIIFGKKIPEPQNTGANQKKYLFFKTRSLSPSPSVLLFSISCHLWRRK